MALEGEKPFDTQFRIKWPDGQIRWIQGKSEVFRDEHGKVVRMLGANYDITDQMNKDIEIQNQRAITPHREKLASLGEIAAGVGHEINDPLAIVMGNALKIIRSVQSGDMSAQAIQEAADVVLSASDRIAKIVGGLRTFARSDNDEIVVSDIYQLVENTYGMYKEIYEKKGIRFTLSPPAKGISAKVNPGKFQQVLVNLISNAKDAVEAQQEKSVYIDFKFEDDDVEV